MQSVTRGNLFTESRRIFIHARWPVQSYVVLGFLFGAVLTFHRIDLAFIVAFFAWLSIVVGLTVLNSYYDKDEAPVGGMQNPPKVNESLLYGALILIAAGLIVGFGFGMTYWLLMLGVVIIYFFYSYEGTRWKTNGYMAVTINAIVGSMTLLGAVAVGTSDLMTPAIIAAGICGAAFKASVYSMMQVHQIEEDTARGDRSMAVMRGRQWTLRFSQITMVIAGIFAVISTYLMNVSILLPLLTGGYFLVGVALFEVWIRQPADTHQDSLRMQLMIQYTGYLGSVSFFVIYLVLLMSGYIGQVL